MVKGTKSVSRTRNKKIGRPSFKAQELLLRDRFRMHKTRFQLQSQLLLLIFNTFHSSSNLGSSETDRVSQEQLVETFELFGKLDLYNILLDNNRSYFQGTLELSPGEKANYTSIIDLSYLFKIVRDRKETLAGQAGPFTNQDVFLTLLFYLNNQKLVNGQFIHYFLPRMESGFFLNLMFEGPLLMADHLSLMIVAFSLEVMDKHHIKVQRQHVLKTVRPSRTPQSTTISVIDMSLQLNMAVTQPPTTDPGVNQVVTSVNPIKTQID